MPSSSIFVGYVGLKIPERIGKRRHPSTRLPSDGYTLIFGYRY
jgi:hypothetical protein